MAVACSRRCQREKRACNILPSAPSRAGVTGGCQSRARTEESLQVGPTRAIPPTPPEPRPSMATSKTKGRNVLSARSTREGRHKSETSTVPEENRPASPSSVRAPGGQPDGALEHLQSSNVSLTRFEKAQKGSKNEFNDLSVLAFSGFRPPKTAQQTPTIAPREGRSCDEGWTAATGAARQERPLSRLASAESRQREPVPRKRRRWRPGAPY